MSVLLNELVITSVLTALEDDEVLNIAEAANHIRARFPSASVSEQDIAMALISEAISRHAPIEFTRRLPAEGQVTTDLVTTRRLPL